MRDPIETKEPSDDGLPDELVERLQAIDEEIAGERSAFEDACDCGRVGAKTPDSSSLHHGKLRRAAGVLQLMHRLRTKEDAPDRASVRDESTDRVAERNPFDSPVSIDTASGVPPSGFRIGNCVVEKEIARGGMGIVFRAQDTQLNRVVALKILRAGPLACEQDRIRFRGEAEAAARLDHPGIVPVYEVGDQDGVLYFTMSLIDGTSLSELVRQSPLAPKRAAEIAKQVAEAVDYAHGLGIVHRDLKPSNVLFDQFERVRVADFGLARRIDGGSDLTETGQVVGTPEYMAPEQASGNASTAGPAADIYSIGAMLYCMLAGHPPFQSSSVVDTLRKVLEQEPISIRKFNRTIPADLETICLRCLEKQPSKRYPDAASLSQDLERFLNGEPIEARRPRLSERGVRWSRRHPLAASMVGILILLAIVGPIIATSQMRLAHEAREARDAMARTLYISDMNLAMRDWDEANLSRCGQLLRRHIPQPGQDDFRGFEWYFLWQQWIQSENVPVVFQDEQLESMALSPDNQILAAGCFDGRLVLWDLSAGREMRSWKAHPYRTYRLSFSKDGSVLASASIDNEVTLWEVQTGTALKRYRGSRVVSFSPRHDSFAYRSQGSSLRLHRSMDDEPVTVSEADPDYVEALAHSGDGTVLASAGWDRQIHLWDAASGSLVKTLTGNEHVIWALACSPTDPILASGDVKGVVRLWNTDTDATISVFQSHQSTINTLAFSPDGELLASGSSDNTVEIRFVSTGRLKRKLRIHSAEIHSVRFADEGRALFTASIDGTVKKWALDDKDRDDVLEHPAMVNSIDFFPDGKRIVTACYDGKIRYWNVDDGSFLGEFVAHQSNIWRVQIIVLDGRTLMITSGQDGAVRLWDAETRELLADLDAQPNALDPLVFAVSPDRSRLVYQSALHEVCLWDLRDHRSITTFEFLELKDAAFSTDGNQLLVAAGPRMSLLDSSTGEVLRHWIGGSKSVTRVQYSPNGAFVAAATHSRLIKIWSCDGLLDFESDQPGRPAVLTGSSGIIAALACSNDSAVIASSGDDAVIRLWDAATGQQRAAIVGHQGSVVDLAFSPNDQILASASLDQTVRLWRGTRTDAAGR